jgi:Uma2 family endonuclease
MLMPMLPPEAEGIDPERIRPLKRVEYDKLVAEGFFGDERIELVFGRLVQMSPIDPAHCESTGRVHEMLFRRLGDRARVRCQSSFAARDDSEPEPDVYVMPNGDYWREHPSRAYLIVEVARSSLRWDRGTKALLYGLSQVDEYWIVNHVDGVVEVYRDRADDGAWRSVTTNGRSDTIAMLAFPDVTIPVGEILPPI